MPTSLRTLAYYYSRWVVYATPLGGPVRRLLGSSAARRQTRTPEYWDAMLSGPFANFKGGTMSVSARNAITAAICRDASPGAVSFLDVGCASGSLAPVLRQFGFRRYVGADISPAAIGEATQLQAADPAVFVPECRFEAADLAAFEPRADERFDVICFNEVLMYLLNAEDAVTQVARYARWLQPGGVLCVSNKDDAKSHAIFSGLVRRFMWTGGLLYQEQPFRPRYRVRFSRENPAYVIGLLRPKVDEPATTVEGEPRQKLAMPAALTNGRAGRPSEATSSAVDMGQTTG